MDEDLRTRLDKTEKKLDMIYASTEKTRKYFLFTLVISITMFILPILGIVLMLPWLLGTLTSAYGL